MTIWKDRYFLNLNIMKIFSFFSFIIGLLIATILIFNRIQFSQNCSGRLERAANANSIELAQSELKAVINYCQVKGWTQGYTSILYKTPDEDVEWWFSNLSACYNELYELPADASTLEKSNALMKLRESLTDSEGVIIPNGLIWYPHNCVWGVFRLLMFSCLILFCIRLLI